MQSPPVQRALISTSDKSGLSQFARGLVDAGISIYSTGGTRRHLEREGLTVHDVAEYTGFPEMMDGRVKTLHPKIFAGILCRQDREDDQEALATHAIKSFELVVVNLYPFEDTIRQPDTSREEAIEQIDIGGPSLVRAAAKNQRFVTIATDPEQYSSILDEINQRGCTSLELRQDLAAAAFRSTANYDRAIADYFSSGGEADDFTPEIDLKLSREAVLRYGENPHQPAAVYRQLGTHGPSLVGAHQLNGKELSYNNLLDLDSALGIVRLIEGPAVAVIKHNNPCGAATAADLAVAARRALDGDPVSAFGSVLGLNRTVDAATAEVLATPGQFIEAIVAPDFEAEAVEILTTKPKWKNNVRLMVVGALDTRPSRLHFRSLEGGMLVQHGDVDNDPENDWNVVTTVKPTSEAWNDLRFGWSIVRHVKSNAIALCQEGALCGVGAGQMSRVDAVDIAIQKAGDRAAGSILSSDAFFPFPDSILKAAEAGIAAVIQPGGSRKDDEVIAACNECNLPMILTGRRHFKH